MKTALSNLEIGQKFRLNTTRTFLKLHVYEIVEKIGDKVKYKMSGIDVYNQTTTASGERDC